MANGLNENNSFKVFADAESVRDQHEKSQRQFNEKVKKEALMSGIGDEVSEADEFLSAMYKPRRKMTLQRVRDHLVVREREQQKLQADMLVTQKALSLRFIT